MQNGIMGALEGAATEDKNGSCERRRL